MTTAISLDAQADIIRRGNEIYDRLANLILKPEDDGKYILIDVDSGDYEVDRNEIAASDRLLARRSHAQVYFRLIGKPYARRYGATRH